MDKPYRNTYRALRRILTHRPIIDNYGDSMGTEMYQLRDKPINWVRIALYGFMAGFIIWIMVGCAFSAELPVGASTHIRMDSGKSYIRASWYSIASLKKEGTWGYSHGKMANGHIFRDDGLTCASRLYPLGSILRVENIKNHKIVLVKVIDRIGRRFAKKRIDLSKAAFAKIADLKQGLINVYVERIK